MLQLPKPTKRGQDSACNATEDHWGGWSAASNAWSNTPRIVEWSESFRWEPRARPDDRNVSRHLIEIIRAFFHWKVLEGNNRDEECPAQDNVEIERKDKRGENCDVAESAIIGSNIAVKKWFRVPKTPQQRLKERKASIWTVGFVEFRQSWPAARSSKDVPARSGAAVSPAADDTS